MIKAPRFMIEYANHKIKRIYDAMGDEKKTTDAVCKITKAVNMYQFGMIAENEAMRTILETWI